MRVLGLLLFFCGLAAPQKPCKFPNDDATKGYCVCNEDYCDEIEDVGMVARGSAVVYYSSASGARLNRTVVQGSFNKQATEVKIDLSTNYQTMVGFGGAFTDSAGINLNKLSATLQDQIIQQYFSSKGMAYTIGRVPMASCDFSTREYSYDDTKDDLALSNFALTDEDRQLKIPYIKKAMQASAGNLRLFSSPWSAPGWMKSNGQMKGPGSLLGDFLGSYYQTWANYFVRFFEEYHKEGIDFWATTVQNEPSTGAQATWKWQTMYLNATMERDFIKTLLGPALAQNSASKDVKIIILDDQRPEVVGWSDTILSDKDAAQYVIGIGLHWYMDFMAPPAELSMVHQRHPDYFMLGTEACTGYLPLEQGPRIGSWERGKNYIDDILDDVSNYVAGWTDWNLVLDLQGGPNWVENYVDAPILVNTTAEKPEYYKNPMWYAMAHFSKFVPPGSIRVKSTLSGSGLPKELRAVAFTQPDSTVAVVLHNGDDKFSGPIDLYYDSNIRYTVTMEPNSIATIVFK